jgi:hypothetical protein
MSRHPSDARNIEFLSKQVKRLKKQYQAQDREAIEAIRTACPDLDARVTGEISHIELHQYEYQAAVARQYGFPSWNEMVAYAHGRPRHLNGRIIISEKKCDTLLEALNERASIYGMPPIGTCRSNKYGLDWVVADYDFVPTPTTFARYPNDCDYLPIIAPLALSQRLLEFINETDRCTSKQILFLDTMPEVHPFKLGRDIHCCNFSGNPEKSYVYVDFDRAHEATIAHELAHLWLIYVEGGDGARTFRNRSDNGKINQLDFLQSFVLDVRVNGLIDQRGFDVSLIMEDKINAMTMVRDALALGYSPSSSRETLICIISMAGAYIEQKRWPLECQERLKELFTAIESMKPEWYLTALRFVDILIHNGHNCKDAVRTSLDQVIKLGFEISGEAIEIERELIEPSLNECMQDKNPKQFEGFTVPLKLEIGKALAKSGIGGDAKITLSTSLFGSAQIDVDCSDGKRIGPLPLNYQLIPFNIVEEQLNRNRHNTPVPNPICVLTDQTSSSLPNPYGRKIVPGMIPDSFGRLPGDPGYNSCTPPGCTPIEQMAALRKAQTQPDIAISGFNEWLGNNSHDPLLPSSSRAVDVKSQFGLPQQAGIDPTGALGNDTMLLKLPLGAEWRRQNMTGIALAVAKEQLRRAQMQSNANLYGYANNNPINLVDTDSSSPIFIAAIPSGQSQPKVDNCKAKCTELANDYISAVEDLNIPWMCRWIILERSTVVSDCKAMCVSNCNSGLAPIEYWPNSEEKCNPKTVAENICNIPNPPPC